MSPELSIEFFPPQTPEGLQKLRAARQALSALQPAFFSVTYGAGGSTREKTFAIVQEMQAEGLCATPHLSCIGASRESLREVLAQYRESGISRIVALRGDLPSGMVDPGELRHASELVEFIRAETGDCFHVSVAAYPEWHPQAKSPAEDLRHFAQKMKAGANAAITQYFYEPEAYFHFVDEAAKLGVDAPVIPGIMPIASFSKLVRFSDMCGTELPRWMRRKFESFYDDTASIRAFGLDVVTRLCERLLEGGAPGLHFYSMNRADLVLEACRRIGLANPQENAK
jgi:methylenetetrahydrofolate reductase (NADPH)